MYSTVIGVCVCVCILFQILFPYRLLHIIEYISLWYTVGRVLVGFLKWILEKIYAPLVWFIIYHL